MLRHITVDVAGPVRHVRLSGEPLGLAEASELRDAAESLREEREVRVVVLGSRGANFCPGADAGLDPLAVSPDPAQALDAIRAPVVAAVRGRCDGVGLELALSADIRIADEDASFCLDTVAVGALPSWGGTQRLPRTVGPATAASMVLLGERLDSDAALARSLVHRVGALDDAVDNVVDRLLGAAPLAVEQATEAMDHGVELPMHEGFRLEAELNHLLSVSEDRAEGLAAFFAKRRPVFHGR
ncbi:MAG: enoyl-CoA hydratase/isomerase family protein [Nocardioides sp.]|uniref:enoyl-CoA hydratase/isomerase family protein n=1 Tax=Nocardioides sp. TaxID=35761 RepID=UPI00239CF5A3|nr:enoyl-CoA hydratase/isomerase family protein [Nocardioides sp.]MDE0778471.1 enoyl-CoA hydratase/isomerase family protein [Nocardioides sp.]